MFNSLSKECVPLHFTSVHGGAKDSVFEVNESINYTINSVSVGNVYSHQLSYSHIDVCHCELCTDRCSETSQQQQWSHVEC